MSGKVETDGSIDNTSPSRSSRLSYRQPPLIDLRPLFIPHIGLGPGIGAQPLSIIRHVKLIRLQTTGSSPPPKWRGHLPTISSGCAKLVPGGIFRGFFNGLVISCGVPQPLLLSVSRVSPPRNLNESGGKLWGFLSLATRKQERSFTGPLDQSRFAG